MGWLLSFLGFIGKCISWFHDSQQRDLGREQQIADDEKEALKTKDSIEQAAENAPRNKQELLEKLKDGDV